ncbi:MAG: hypothetical protein IPK72_17630 [Candidatus Eisenbacteria bacterium]|nr:hypothetical protein [Candidatus Eisenbacteria bacterium]
MRCRPSGYHTGRVGDQRLGCHHGGNDRILVNPPGWSASGVCWIPTVNGWGMVARSAIATWMLSSTNWKSLSEVLIIAGGWMYGE